MRAAVVTLLILAACSAPAQAPPPTASSGLAGTSWKLVKFQGGDEKTLTPDDGGIYEFAPMPER